MEIVNDLVKDAKYEEYFNVKLSDSENPAIRMKVDFEGMPVQTLLKLAFNELKVKGRPAMKKLTLEGLKKTYDGETVSWQVLLSKDAATSHAQLCNMSDEALEAKILEIQKKRELAHLVE